MDSSSGNSSGSTQIQNSGCDEDLMDLRKRKRMLSNRESARRSRMRKKKHVDDLTDHINQLKNNNSQIITTIKVTTQQSVRIEAENSILSAQVVELSQRLDALNEIISCMNNESVDDGISMQHTNGISGMFESEQPDFFNNQWNMMYLNQQAIMVSGCDVFEY
ncbi:bZIP transcription factor 11-like protein [Tanacetum coccineum]